MPELPEVETLRTELIELTGKRVSNYFSSHRNSKVESEQNIQQIVNQNLTAIERRGRYLIFNFDNQKSLVTHLGMSGRMLLSEVAPGQRHDHFALQFEGQTWLVFNDPRKFGSISLTRTNSLNQFKSIAKLGVEPLSESFNADYFYSIINKRKSNIKALIMDNQVVVGIGNIYTSEALFDAKILPTRLGNSLSFDEAQKLIASAKKILTKAIKHRGSSIQDYVRTNGQSGKFQKLFLVYGRAGQKCSICEDKIKRIVQQQRSSFYCPGCQS